MSTSPARDPSEHLGEDERTVAVLPATELPDGSARCVDALGTVIALFNVNGRIYALDNTCPHAGGPLCFGSVGGTSLPSDRDGEYRWGLEGRVLTCPWHGWQFDLDTGGTIFDPDVAVMTYGAEIRQGWIVVSDR